MATYQKDAALLWSAQGSTAISDTYLIPGASAVLLHGYMVSVTAATLRIEQRIPGESNWGVAATLSLSGTGDNEIVIAEAPVGEIRFRITANNGTVTAAFAAHYPR